MRVVALVSGGKDSCFNMVKCADHGHTIVALANLHPAAPDDAAAAPGAAAPQELDSFCFQTVGHQVVRAVADAMGVPLVRRAFAGRAVVKGLHYAEPTPGDEVEDLYELLKEVQRRHPEVEAVSSGAILSTYQRLRVESVCRRLGLTSLAFMWQRNQVALLDDMIARGLHAVLIKVAGHGISPHEHLGRSLGDLRDHFVRLQERHGFQPCGEGGEYETMTLDCSLFKCRIVVDEAEVVETDPRSQVGHWIIKRFHLEDKEATLRGGGGAATTAGAASKEATDKSPSRPAAAMVAAVPSPPPPTAPPLRLGAPPALDEATRSVLSVGAHRRGDHIHVGGVVGADLASAVAHISLADEAQCMMDRLLARVTSAFDLAAPDADAEGVAGAADVVFVNLYLVDMSHFKAINAVYCQAFGYNPPSRACVQVTKLPPGARCMADCVAFAGSGAHIGDARVTFPRDVLHVQSISEWAPTCIGPYSQANMLCGLHFQAGQIGLDPASMKLVRGGLVAETAQALRNCEAVLRCCRSAPELVGSCVVFVNAKCDSDQARQGLRQTIGAWLCRHQGTAAVVDSVVAFVAVPELPRGAAVELLLTAVDTNVASSLGRLTPCPVEGTFHVGGYRVRAHGMHLRDCLYLGYVDVCPVDIETQAGDEEAADVGLLFGEALRRCERQVATAGLQWSHVAMLHIYYQASLLPRGSGAAFGAQLASMCLPLSADVEDGDHMPPAMTWVGVEQDALLRIVVRAYDLDALQQGVRRAVACGSGTSNGIRKGAVAVGDVDVEQLGEEQQVVPEEDMMAGQGLAQAMAAAAAADREADDGDGVCSDVSDMSDVSDIFPSIPAGGVCLDEDDDEDEEEGT